MGHPASRTGHHGEFSRRHAMHVRDGDLADEGFPLGLQRRSFHAPATEGIGAVEHDELLAAFGGGFHGHDHGTDVGVAAAADVLQVKHEHVDGGEHRRGRFARGTVQRINDETGHAVAPGADVHAGADGAVDAMLRRIQRDEIPTQRALHGGACALPTTRHAGLVGDEADPFALNEIKIA